MLEKIVMFYDKEGFVCSLTKKVQSNTLGACGQCAFDNDAVSCDKQDQSKVNCYSFDDKYVWEKYVDFLKDIKTPCSTRLSETVNDQTSFIGNQPDTYVVVVDESTQFYSKESKKMILSTDSVERKNTPIASGVLDYFPLAVAEVSKCSKAGNDQHNPGQPLHWDKSKSTDHADCIGRHLIDRGSFDTDGVRHSAKLAWRALALLQIELENEKGNK